jgi:acetyl esterase/lipase
MKPKFQRVLGVVAAGSLVAVALVALVSESQAAAPHQAAPHQAASQREAGFAPKATQPEIVYVNGKFTNPTTRNIVTWLPSQPPNYRIVYDNSGLGQTFGNLRLPKSKAPKAGYPVVVLLHGGGWQSVWPYDYLEPFADSLTQRGIATWNIEYRRPGQRGGGWPGTFLDVAHATDFVRTLAPKFHLDLSRVVVSGQSAGGHLAVWVASRHKIPKTSPIYTPNPLPVRGVVSLDAWALDMRYDIEHGVDSAAPGTVLFDLLGVQTAEQALARVDADGPSPTQLLPIGTSIELFTGTVCCYRDANTRYAQAAAAAGDNVKLTLFRGGTHFDPVDVCGPGWPYVVTAIFNQLHEKITAKDLANPSPRLCRRMNVDQPSQ